MAGPGMPQATDFSRTKRESRGRLGRWIILLDSWPMCPAVELYYDSGVRSGRDVAKALCLGARGVGIGRPYYWAAACGGEEGIVQLVQQLTAELKLCMQQLGVSQLRQLNPRLLAWDRLQSNL
ncbi:unnamed protein product [Cladocopium goreaui]|uniref:L-lactate dehydrogenase (Cytochrome) (Cytochrom e b2) (Flavocytochrome b2) (FCB2) (L-lactate ferricytochrome c oxidoreductase) (L-LCR) n=1 Tax=Cladocopium goreaui TaxID=2562237 RepID=A0A9P1DRH2_9DINO|nr:unnamed protein product [Cladocopium goreaui]